MSWHTDMAPQHVDFYVIMSVCAELAAARAERQTAGEPVAAVTWEPLQPHSASADNIAAAAMCGAGASGGDAEQPVRVRHRFLASQLGVR